MSRSQESFNKKEVRNKKDKKRKEKEKKRLVKKENDKKKSFDEMIAYVDEFGVISSTPPDPSKKSEVNIEDIELGATKVEPSDKPGSDKRGIVTFYNQSKGFGFIRDTDTNRNVFFHVKNLLDEVTENDVVSYEAGKGPKGPVALKVRLV